MYGDYLKDLLRPLRIYELDSGYGAEELETQGEQLDEIFAALNKAEAEAIVPTAEDYGLSAYEKLLPYVPSYISLEDRRRAIMALLRIDGCSFTPEELQATISGCGIYATVKETDEWYTVRVQFPECRGMPENFEQLKKRIDQILPCHLNIEYYFDFITWLILERTFMTWAELEALNLSWAQLETYV